MRWLFSFIVLLSVSVSSYAWKMEAGSINLPSTSGATQYTQFNFQQSYDQAPLVFIVATDDGPNASHVRIKNVTTTSFEAASVEPLSEDGPHTDMDVHYFAIERGTSGSQWEYTLPDGSPDGIRIVVGEVSTNSQSFNNTQGNAHDKTNVERVRFPSPDFSTTPTVLAQIQTLNNSPSHEPRNPLSPWLSTVVTDVRDDRFDVSLERSEDYDRISGSNYRTDDIADETIGYVVMESNQQGVVQAVGGFNVAFETINTGDLFEGFNDACRTQNFSNTYSSSPLVMATKISRNEDDGGWFRRCSLNSSRVGLQVDEETRQDSERSHVPEQASLLVFGAAFTYDSEYQPPAQGTNLMLEAGTVTFSAKDTWQTIQLRQSYETKPAVFVLTDNNNPDPQAFRIRNVTEDSFQAIALEPSKRSGLSDAPETDMEMHYVVMPVGQYQFPNSGPSFEVGLVSINNYQSKSLAGDSYFNLVFSSAFTSTPSVLAQVQTTENGVSTTDPWLTAFANSPSTTGALLAMDRAEVTAGGIGLFNEEVAYLAIEQGVIPDFKDLNGLVISAEANTSQDNITGNCTNTPFLQTYPQSPLVVSNKQSLDGGDGGWIRRCSVSVSAAQLRIDEDQFTDSDRAHTTEEAAYIAFSEPFVADFSNQAYYQLDERAWTNGAGQALDSSNYNLHGTPRNNAGTTPARVCYGADFDGSTQYVNVPDTSSLQIEDELTVSVWVNPSSYGSELRTIVSKDVNYEFHLNSSGQVFWWWGGTPREITSNSSVPLNVWTHIAVVYSQSQPYQAIYINGVLDISATADLGALTVDNSPLQIGSDQEFSGRFWDGKIDEIRVYSRAISAEGIEDIYNYTHPCVTALDHIEIVASSTTNSTCAPVDVTLRACADNASPCNLLDDYTGTFTLSTTTGRGSWSKKDGFAINDVMDGIPDDGNATYTFDAADNGEVVLELDYFYQESLIASALDSEEGYTEQTQPMSFSDNAFVVEWVDPIDTDAVADTVAIAGRNHQLQVSYIRKDSGGQCGVVDSYDGTKDLAVWYRETSGVFTSSPNAPGLTGTAQSIAAVPSSEPSVGTTNLQVDFSAGVADLELVTSDVGHFTLSVKDENVVEPSSSGPVAISGESATAIVRPFAYVADVGGTCSGLAAGDRSGGTNASIAADHTGGPFMAAGVPFDLHIRAVQYQAGDSDAGGNPVAGANLYDNACVTGHGLESSSTAKTVNLAIASYQPALGASPSWLHNSLQFSGGQVTQSTSYDEVGILSFDLTNSNYLGSGDSISGQLYNLGRFYPAYFSVAHAPDPLELQSPMFNADPLLSCDFTYLGQNFGLNGDIELTVTAREADGAITTNYGGDFWKLGLPATPEESISDAVSATKNSVLQISGSTITLTETSDFDGEGLITFSGIGLQYDRENGVDAPFAGEIDWAWSAVGLTDTDLACYEPTPGDGCEAYSLSGITGTELRYGRAFVGNNYGSELLPLELPVQLQYWQETASGNGQFSFLVNEDDICSYTAWTDSDITLQENKGALDLAETSASLGSFSNGAGIILLTAPGTTNEGSVNTELDVESWLMFDFYQRDKVNPLDENPIGTATFGVFSGRQPIFYLRESYR